MVQIIGLIAFVGLIGACGATSTPADEASDDAGKAEGGSREEMIAIGQAGRDGHFEFEVSDFDCSDDTIGSGFMKSTADGVYCVATVTVENISDESQMLDATSQYLFDSKDREFETSSDVIFSLPESGVFLKDLNPGIKKEVMLVFDVPTDIKPVYLDLHDSMFSEGIKVSVKKG